MRENVHIFKKRVCVCFYFVFLLTSASWQTRSENVEKSVGITLEMVGFCSNIMVNEILSQILFCFLFWGHTTAITSFRKSYSFAVPICESVFMLFKIYDRMFFFLLFLIDWVAHPVSVMWCMGNTRADCVNKAGQTQDKHMINCTVTISVWTKQQIRKQVC